MVDNNELARLLAGGGNLSADEMSIKAASPEDLDQDKIYNRQYLWVIESLDGNLHINRSQPHA